MQNLERVLNLASWCREKVIKLFFHVTSKPSSIHLFQMALKPCEMAFIWRLNSYFFQKITKIVQRLRALLPDPHASIR